MNDMLTPLFRLVSVLIFTLIIAYGSAVAGYDPKWEWQTTSNAHFTLYYPKGHENTAARIMHLSDKVYNDISGYLGVKPDHCPIVLNPGTDLFNGFYSPFPNRISLFETPLANARQMHPGSDTMDLLFTHEYTHFAHITTRSGWYDWITTVFGDGIGITNGIAPGWIIEGITTNTETLFTDGGRGKSAFFRGTMLSFLDDDGQLWGLSAAGTGTPYAPPGYGRIYLSGYFMVDYLNRHYGKDAIARLSGFQGAHPLGFSSKALHHVTGKTGKAFYADFLTDLKAQALADKAKASAANLPQGTLLAAERFESYQSFFWKDNTHLIALRKGYEKKNALVVIGTDFKTVDREYETGFYNGMYPIKSMDNGRKVVSGGYYPDLFGGSDLMQCDLKRYDIDTGKHHRLTTGAHIFSADYGEQTGQFAAVRRNGMWSEIVLISQDGNAIEPLISIPGCTFESPVWSPDNTQIAAVIQSGKNSDIVVCNPETGTIQTLFQTDSYEDNDPSFSADGQWLVFSSDRSGIWNIYAWHLQQQALYQLTSVAYGAFHPVLSPDTRTLAFLSLQGGVNSIHTMPFAPEAGKPIPVPPGTSINTPDRQQLTPPPLPTPGQGIPVFEAMAPYLRLPYFSKDEDGTVAGITLLGADPIGINAYQLSLFYGMDSHRPGIDLYYTNTALTPDLTLRLYDSSEEGNRVGNTTVWFRERGIEAGIRLQLFHSISPASLTTAFTAGGKFRNFQAIGHDAEANATGFYSTVQWVNQPDHAKRDVQDTHNTSIFIAYEKDLDTLGGDFPGENTIVTASHSLPAFIRHHNIFVSGTFQTQNGVITYARESLPRGYSNSDTAANPVASHTVKATAEYHFPISYREAGLGLTALHLLLLKGALFVDYGGGWEKTFDKDPFVKKARTSVGMSLASELTVMGILPLETGVEAGYQVKEKEIFFNMIVKARF